MARRRSYRSRLAKRDVLTIATQRVPSRALLAARPAVSFLDDRRLFHPEPFRAPVLFTTTRPARIVAARNTNHGRKFRTDNVSRAKLLSPAGVVFDEPRSVTVCVRRKARREVLFAKRKTGRGARSPKTRNFWSNVKCR